MNKSNFVIVTHPRSGFHMLSTMLGSHPKIENGGEKFNLLNQPECNSEFRIYANPPNHNAKIRGFKLPYRFRKMEINDIWEKVKLNKQLKILHWHRSNLLRAYVSWEIANKSKTWLGTKAQPFLSEKRITIELKSCLNWINMTHRLQKISEFEFRDHTSFTASYENFLAHNNKMKEILQFLEVDTTVELSTNFIKQNPEPLIQLIVNYDEFESSFKKTKWSIFLEE